MSRLFIPIILLTVSAFGQPLADAESLLSRTFPYTAKLLHKPPKPFFQGRPYNLEFFCDLPQDSLEAIVLFFKTDQFLQYREVPLEPYRGRFRFRYDPKLHPGEEVSYFFVAVLKSAGIHAIPVDRQGKLAPYRIRPVDPIKYYESITPR